MDDLRADERLHLSGLSVPDSGVIAHDVIEGYVFSRDVEGLLDDYFLVRPDGARGNVFLHVIHEEAQGVPRAIDIAWPLVAIDLAEHSGARERERAAELLREMLPT